eukprot:gene10949-14702_t
MNSEYISTKVTELLEIMCCDSPIYLQTIPVDGFPIGSSVFTSLPDISELPQLFGGYKNLRVKSYETWFTNTVELILNRLPVGGYAIFLQSDVRVCLDGEVKCWIDKSFLCSLAAHNTGLCTLMWHKLVTAHKLHTKRSAGRPAYSHLICYHKTRSIPILHHENISNPIKHEEPTYRTAMFAIPDIFFRGEMLWSKGIGLDCCYVGVSFLKNVAKSSLIIDPFCGHGTVLAMANALGVSALGMEISSKRCRFASTLNLKNKLSLVSDYLRKQNFELDIVSERMKFKKNNKNDDDENENENEDDTNGFND